MGESIRGGGEGVSEMSKIWSALFMNSPSSEDWKKIQTQTFFNVASHVESANCQRNHSMNGWSNFQKNCWKKNPEWFAGLFSKAIPEIICKEMSNKLPWSKSQRHFQEKSQITWKRISLSVVEEQICLRCWTNSVWKLFWKSLEYLLE